MILHQIGEKPDFGIVLILAGEKVRNINRQKMIYMWGTITIATHLYVALTSLYCLHLIENILSTVVINPLFNFPFYHILLSRLSDYGHWKSCWE